MASALFHFSLCKQIHSYFQALNTAQRGQNVTAQGVNNNILAPPMKFLPTNLCREKRVTYQQHKVSHSFSCCVTSYVADTSGCHSWHLSNLLAAACCERTQHHPAATSENTFKESMQTRRNHPTKRAICMQTGNGQL